MLTSQSASDREARVRYFDGHFEKLAPGAYVTCAVTDRKIPIDLLRYWSVDLQEPYFDAAASHKRKTQLDAEQA